MLKRQRPVKIGAAAARYAMPPNKTPEIANRLAAIRKERGIAAADLAEAVGVTRQTIYAVEAGTYIPNTAIGLKLAQALSVRIDDIFSLTEPNTAEPPLEKAILLPSSDDPLQPGQAVRLAKVNGKLLASPAVPWYLPTIDGMIVDADSSGRMARIALGESSEQFEDRILLAGCDPAMSVLAHRLQTSRQEIVLLHQNSSQSLSLLKSGYAHLAGTHLGDANLATVNRLFPAKSAALITFAVWQEGLALSPGNPKHFKSLEDLVRPDMVFINREAGSGSRVLLDRHLKQLTLRPKNVRGYNETAPSHLAAAWAVKSGRADCCLCTEAAARFFGLHFIPLESVRYDFVLRKQQLTHPRVEAILNVINQLTFRRKLSALGGYDTSQTGSRLQ